MFAFLLLPVSKPGWSVFNLKNLDIQWMVGNELWQIGDKWNFPMCYLVASGNCKSIFLIHDSGGQLYVCTLESSGYGHFCWLCLCAHIIVASVAAWQMVESPRVVTNIFVNIPYG